MTMQPDTDPIKEGMQSKCCVDNLDFYYYGDGVEWEMWECKKCKLMIYLEFWFLKFNNK